MTRATRTCASVVRLTRDNYVVLADGDPRKNANNPLLESKFAGRRTASHLPLDCESLPE